MASITDRLRSLFGISVKSKNNQVEILPAETNSDPKDRTFKTKPIKMSPELQRLYNAWISDNFDTSETFKDRLERYKDLEFAYYNNGIFSTAVDLYSDETTQADTQSDIIGIYAKDTKVEKYIREFFENIGINENMLKALAFDLSLYGDAFWTHSIDSKYGITEITPIEPKTVQERIEFNAIQYKERQKELNGFQQYLNKFSTFKELKNALDSEESNNLSKLYKSYLFGFVVSDFVVAPWSVSHFRRFSTNSEFAPFGRPIMINAIAPFRQLQASKNLMTLLRTQKFPLRIFKLAGNQGTQSEARLWEKLEEVRSDFYNQASSPSQKDNFATQTDLWTIENLFNIQVEEMRTSLNDIADIELLQDNLIIATRIPKGYLITDRGAFGQSGQSLLQQSKIFGRSVYTIQTAILETLVDLVRLQFVLTGDYEYDTDFELTLNFPVQEQSSDQLRMKNDSLRLAKDIIDNVGQAIGLERDEALPADIVKEILSKYSFLDHEEIEVWVDSILAAREAPSDDKPDGNNGNFWDAKRKKVEDKVNRRLTEDTLRLAYFKAKENMNLEEGVMNKKHFKNSSFISSKQRQYYDFIKKELNGDKEKNKLNETFARYDKSKKK